MSSTTDNRPRKLPFVVLVLSAGTFLMGTTEFVIAGLLHTGRAVRVDHPDPAL